MRDDLCVINLNERDAVCANCGCATRYRWGLPIGPDGLIVPASFQGEWAGVAACLTCFMLHAEGRLDNKELGEVK